MTIKHRNSRRVSVGQLIMQVHGSCAAGTFYGVMGNLSAHGCFILSYARVAPNEVIEGRVLLPTERWFDFRGGVAHYSEGVGFGVRFLGLTEEERAMIELVVDYALNLSFNVGTDPHTTASPDALPASREAAVAAVIASVAGEPERPAERRQHPRTNAVGALHTEGQPAGTSAIENIGMGGLFLRTKARVKVGDTVTLRLPLGGTDPLVVKAAVVHIQAGVGVGFCFFWDGEQDPNRTRLAREIALQAGVIKQ